MTKPAPDPRHDQAFAALCLGLKARGKVLRVPLKGPAHITDRDPLERIIRAATEAKG